MTYYELLGVDVDAPLPVIRAAYRRAARAHHPDRHGGSSSSRMAEVNQAWTTLSDPVRRREYDLSLGEGSASPTSAVRTEPTAGPAEPRWNPLARYQDPPRFPWRPMGVMAALGAVAVLVGMATASSPSPPTIDNLLTNGDCVVIEANGDAAEQRCSDAHDGVVVAFLVAGGLCPEGSAPHRDRQGLGTACVQRP